MKKMILWLVFKFYYLPWSRLYRFFEKRRFKHYKNLVTHAENAIIRSEKPDAGKWWTAFLAEFPEMKWRKDTVGMLFDVVSDPYIALKRGDDCDGFAMLAAVVLGPVVKVADAKCPYESEDIWFCHSKDLTSGHAVAVWSGPSGRLFVVSNSMSKTFNTESQFLAWFKDSFSFEVAYISRVTKKLKYKGVRSV